VQADWRGYTMMGTEPPVIIYRFKSAGAGF